MEFDSTLLLAFVQSATEFLPVSSSGHLVLMEKFGFSNQTLLMDIALHLGTLFAVCLFFAKDIWLLVKGFWHKGEKQQEGYKLMIATIPVLIIGFFLHNIIETALRSPLIIAFNACFYGILLWWIDVKSPVSKNISQMTYKNALAIGLAQALALIPGTSRSGITMTCARYLGFSRTESAKFSMLLSIPTIFCGAAFMFINAYFSKTPLSNDLLLQIGGGITAAALFGLIAVWFLMRWLKTASFAIFAIYRIVLGIALFIIFL